MADSAQNRHLPASARKIEKAREDGQVARSRDLGHFAAVAGGGMLLAALAPAFTGWLKQLVANGLVFDARSLAGGRRSVADIGSLRPSPRHVGQSRLFIIAISECNPANAAFRGHDQRMAEGRGMEAVTDSQRTAARLEIARRHRFMGDEQVVQTARA